MILAQCFKWIITHQLLGFCVTINLCSKPNPLSQLLPGVLVLAPVPERPISTNPGLKILFRLLYLLSYALLRVTLYVIMTESRSKDTTVFCKLE